MLDIERKVIVAGEDDFCADGICRSEEIAVGLRAPGIDGIAARCNEFLSCCSGLLEIPLPGMAFKRDVVVFTEGSLEEACAGLKGHCRPLCHLVEGVLGRKMLDCKIKVRHNVGHHQFAAVARFI